MVGYAWGGDTRDWRGSGSYDYDSARGRYDKAAAGRDSRKTFVRSRTPDMSLVDPLGKILSSDSTDVVAVAIDVSGSMVNWPGEMFDRQPLFCQTLGKFRPNVEFAFGAIGDAYGDSYPLQVNQFYASDKISELEAALNGLGVEGGGGGGMSESYELFGYYMLTHCKTPKATSPFLLIYGDEGFYDKVDPRQVKHFIGDDLQSPMDSFEMWDKLSQKFNVYFLHKPYGHGGDSRVDKEVSAKWAGALGRQRVIELPYSIKTEDGDEILGQERAVDFAMGLVAKHWGEYGDFTKSLDARHDDASVKDAVHHTLRHVDSDPSPKSVTRGKKTSKRTNPLL